MLATAYSRARPATLELSVIISVKNCNGVNQCHTPHSVRDSLREETAVLNREVL